MKLEDGPDLEPQEDQVLIAVEAAGVNPVEVYVRSGAYPVLPALPYVPGNDAAGRVVSVGPGVTRFKVGERVYTFGRNGGAYATQTLVSEVFVQHLPDRVSFAQGAALGVPYGTAHRALFGRAHARPGETVLIHGASGGVGTAAVQFSRAAGLRVFGTAGTPAGLNAVISSGAHEAFDHSNPHYWDEIMAATEGKGLDVIIEFLANINLAKDLSGLSQGGRVAVVGSRGPLEIDPRATISRDLTIVGVGLANVSAPELCSIHSAVRAGLENGVLNPVVACELPLVDAPKAHERVMQGGKNGKIVLTNG
jgi:NADPH2:quinone reductase